MPSTINNVSNYDTDISHKLIESYFEKQHLDRLVRHQKESYNQFVSEQIRETIQMFNPVLIRPIYIKDDITGLYSLEIIITFDNLQIYRPQIHENNGATKIMFPQEARLRNFTYASTMSVDVNIKIIKRTGENLSSVETLYKKLPRINIGKMPIMLKNLIFVF